MIKRLIILHKSPSNFFLFFERSSEIFLSLFFYYHHEPTLIVFISINCDSPLSARSTISLVDALHLLLSQRN